MRRWIEPEDAKRQIEHYELHMHTGGGHECGIDVRITSVRLKKDSVVANVYVDHVFDGLRKRYLNVPYPKAFFNLKGGRG